MKIPFAIPTIDEDVVKEVNDALLNTGWITTGPKVLALEEEVRKLIGVEACNCINSWTSCLLYTSPSPRDATLSRMPSSA